MRDFSWKVFSNTGDVDAYLLYKQMGEGAPAEPDYDEDLADEDADIIN